MKVFVNKRLCEPPYSDHHLNAHIQKNDPNTLSSLYEVVQPSNGKQHIIIVDRNVLQRLLTAFTEGR